MLQRHTTSIEQELLKKWGLDGSYSSKYVLLELQNKIKFSYRRARLLSCIVESTAENKWFFQVWDVRVG